MEEDLVAQEAVTAAETGKLRLFADAVEERGSCPAKSSTPRWPRQAARHGTPGAPRSSSSSNVRSSAARSINGLHAAAILDPATLSNKAADFEVRTKTEALEAVPLREATGHARSAAVRPMGDNARWRRLAGDAYVAVAAAEPQAGGLGEFADLSEPVPWEPGPIVPGERSGWWSPWEVRPDADGAARDCLALSTTDAAAVRPDLTERVWLRLATLDRVEVGPPLRPELLAGLQDAGADHAWQVVSRLARGDDPAAPWLHLRLVVRVEGEA